jgi:hypothetical protein
MPLNGKLLTFIADMSAGLSGVLSVSLRPSELRISLRVLAAIIPLMLLLEDALLIRALSSLYSVLSVISFLSSV